MGFSITCALAAATCLFATHALAQSRGDPADPNLRVPALQYDSALGAYQRFSEQKPERWREVNEEMGALGGHEGHVKGDAKPAPAGNAGAQSAPAAAPSAPAAPASAAKPNAPGGHKHHH